MVKIDFIRSILRSMCGSPQATQKLIVTDETYQGSIGRKSGALSYDKSSDLLVSVK